MTTKKDEQVGKYMSILLEDARQRRMKAGHDARWTENAKLLKGEQEIGRGKMSGGWKSDYVTNILFAQKQTIVPILANRMARIQANPITNRSGDKEAKELTSLIARILMRNEYINRQIERVDNMMDTGKAYMKPVWDKNMFGNRGDIRIEVPDTRSIYLEPGKMRVRDMNYIFEVRQIDKLTLYRMYPDQHKKVDAIFRKGSKGTTYDVEYGENTGEVGYHAAAPGAEALTTTEAYVFDVAAQKDKDKESIDFSEAWFYDERTVEDTIKINTIGDDGARSTKKKKVNRKVYPTGRMITHSGETVFDDRPNPFQKFPYIETFNYYKVGEYYGLDEFSQLKSLQEQLNIRTNQIADGLNFTNFPLIFVDHTAGIDIDEIQNKPGGLIPCADVNGIKVMNIAAPTEGAFTSVMHILQMFETVSGVQEVTHGKVPGDVRSGFAIEQLQESAQSRLRLKTRNIETADRELARYLTYMIGAFYIKGVHYSSEVDLRGITPDMFEYEVKAGVNLPASRMNEQMMYQWMMTQQVVDELFIAENFDVPNVEELKGRMQPIWDAKREAMLAAAQPEPQPGQEGLQAV